MVGITTPTGSRTLWQVCSCSYFLNHEFDTNRDNSRLRISCGALQLHLTFGSCYAVNHPNLIGRGLSAEDDKLISLYYVR